MATVGKKGQAVPVALVCPPCRTASLAGVRVIADRCRVCRKALCRHLFHIVEPGVPVTCWPCVRERERMLGLADHVKASA